MPVIQESWLTLVEYCYKHRKRIYIRVHRPEGLGVRFENILLVDATATDVLEHLLAWGDKFVPRLDDANLECGCDAQTPELGRTRVDDKD